ncbi:MAG: phosphopyruvate hydratase, partial [Acidimicrobiia bacterium]
MTAAIADLRGYEILDSRGQPTIFTTCVLTDGTEKSVSVPSGRSTGRWEAHELRDGDPDRFDGRGCLQAIDGINSLIRAELIGMPVSDQAGLDGRMIELDGTGNRSRLGANAMLSVSLAACRAAARSSGVELWQYLAAMANNEAPGLPRLTVNLLSGGLHAGQQVPVQDVLLVPVAAASVEESLVAVSDVFSAAVGLSTSRYGARLLTADEGGLAPPFRSTDEMLDFAVAAIVASGQEERMRLAVDVAASHLTGGRGYQFEGRSLTGRMMIEEIRGWLSRYPIVSIEDGLDQDDWGHWSDLTALIGDSTLVVGDDLLCTQTSRVQRAIEEDAANALLIKPNQVGTVTEALLAMQTARRAGWPVVASARSGETEDDWLADLAVGWSADFIKVGSITQSD